MSHLQLSLSIWRTLVQGSHGAKVWGCSAVHIKWCNVCRWPVLTLPWTLNNLLVLIPKNVSDMSVVTDYCLQTNGKRKVCPWSIQVHSPLDIFDLYSHLNPWMWRPLTQRADRTQNSEVIVSGDFLTTLWQPSLGLLSLFWTCIAD